MPDIINQDALKDLVRQVVKEELAKAKVDEVTDKPLAPTTPFSSPASDFLPPKPPTIDTFKPNTPLTPPPVAPPKPNLPPPPPPPVVNQPKPAFPMSNNLPPAPTSPASNPPDMAI